MRFAVPTVVATGVAPVIVLVMVFAGMTPLGEGQAQARPHTVASAPKPTVWAQIVSPHEAEVSHIIMLVSQHYSGMISGYLEEYDEDLSDSDRLRMLRDLFGMIRYAARLAPQRAEVQYWLGVLADDLGDRDLAVSALERYLATTTQEKLEPGAIGRLGRNQFMLGRTRAGIASLRRAIAVHEQQSEPRNLAIFHLAQAHMLDGALPVAIDLLQASLEPTAFGAIGDLRLGLSLAVAYDRDEQLTRAHERLAAIGSMMSGEDLIGLVQQQLPPSSFLSPIDYLYYQAIILELGEALAQARDVWLAYAQAPFDQAPYRARALAHVRALDRLLRAPQAVPTVAPTRRGPSRP